ncbi:TPA: hypothetical protein OQU49_004384, partial [Shigella flexneri]|nr:hypothetical protein [Shigella flexneri]
QDHIDGETYPPSEAEVSRRLKMKSPSTLNNWKRGAITELPRREYLWAVVDLTGASIQRVLDAALTDAGYYERGEEHGIRAATTKDAGETPASDNNVTPFPVRANRPARAARRGVKKKDDDPGKD